MSKNTILCKCLICLKQNKNGILISMRTYNRYHKNQQEFLDIGEININHQEQNIEEEDIYQHDENYNNFDMDDTESFNFNEEDIEYYSDYNNNNNSDNDSDDDNDNDENNDDIM